MPNMQILLHFRLILGISTMLTEYTCSLTHARFVQTDMGNRGAQCNGLERAPMTITESVQGIVNQVCIITCVQHIRDLT